MNENFKKCPKCGWEIARVATVCPNCNHDFLKTQNVKKKKEISKTGVLSLVVSIFGMAIFDSGVGIFFAIAGIFLALCSLFSKKDTGNKSAIAGLIISLLLVFAVFGDSEDDGSKKNDKEYIAEVTKEPKSEKKEDKKKTKEKNTDEEKIKETDNKKVEDTPKPTEKPLKKDKFLVDMENHVEEKVAKKIYVVLKEKIGFKKINFIKKMEDTSNYEIKADKFKIVVTASDKLYRIFTPNSYTYYENGKIKNTKEQVQKKIKKKKKTEISYYDRSIYYTIAKDIVKQGLKSPSSADFPTLTFSPEDIRMSRNGKKLTVQSYVDSDNSFGASIRNDWTVQYKVIDKDSYSYKVLYVNIGGSVLYGKYKK